MGLLPPNERVQIHASNHWRIWLYGESFSGKTYLADKFPNVLMLNTDGNTDEVTAQRLRIADQIKVEGNITKTTKLAWEYFKDIIAELKRKENTFETIVLDLYEDFYEFCRLYMYDKLNIRHESDAIKSWDMVRTEFYSTMRGLFTLPYNFILLSQEDKSRDIMGKGGDKITAIKPNLADKVALKTAGMVTLTARVIRNGNNRVISFKTSDVIFGGGRIPIQDVDIPCTYEDLMKVLNEIRDTPKEAPRSDTKLNEPLPKPVSNMADDTDKLQKTIVSEEPTPKAMNDEETVEKLMEGDWSGNQGLDESEPSKKDEDEKSAPEPQPDPASESRPRRRRRAE